MSTIRRLAAAALAAVSVSIVGAPWAQPAAAQPAPSGDRFEGVLTALWADPHADSAAASKIHFSLVYPDGASAEVAVGPELQSRALQLAGKRVVVSGSSASSQSGREAAAASASVTASAIEAAAGVESNAAAVQQAVTGTKKVLFILLKFKGDGQQPHSPGFYKQLTDPLTGTSIIPGTINGFFDKVSYGRLKWASTVAGNKWYTLSKTRAQYANCGANSACFAPILNQLAAEGIALVKRDVDVNTFDNINFVFNNDLDCCAWGGGFHNGSRGWGVTYEPPWAQEAGTYVHEMGHSLGLPHSGWRYADYDSNHDQMSRGASARTVECGTYDSVNFGGPNKPIFCTEPGGGFIMAHQDKLGWVPQARKAIHSTTTVKTYDIEANARPLSSKLKVVVVCLKGSACSSAQAAGRFLTVEVKTRSTAADKGVPSQGVVIHEVDMDRQPVSGGCYFNDASGWAMPFDATTGDWNTTTCQGKGLANLAYSVGKSFKSTSLGVKVEVLSKTGDVYRVRVTKSK